MSAVASPPTPVGRREPAVVPGAFVGTATLVRLQLRRDRVRVPVWTLGICGFLVGAAVGMADLFGSPADRASRARLMDSPMMRAFNGPGYGLDDYTVGAMVANELLVLGAVAAALMSILLVVRHTRLEEEAGRAELLRAGVLGVHAVPTAALLTVSAVNVALGGVTAVVLAAGQAELPLVGAWAFGLSMAAVGIVFAAVAAVAAQLTEHARAAVGLASVGLAAAFLLRAVGDVGGVGDRALSWASPLGWAQSTRAFVDERWWPLLLCLATATVLAVLALAIGARRDVGAGLVRPRPGRGRASAWLVRPVGLAMRLHRGSLLAWTLGLLVLGAGFGAVIGDIDEFIADNPQVEEVLGAVEGAGLLESFLATVVLIIALLAAGQAVAGALRLRAEETEGPAEALLTASLPRARWVGAHLLVVGVGSALALTAGSLGLGVAAAVDRDDHSLVAELVGAGLGHVPAVWVMVGIAVALFGLAPRLTSLAWVVLAHAVLVGLLGEVLDLPEPLRALSPLHHVPDLPAADPSWGATVGLVAVAVALVVAGVLGFRRRDLATA